MYAVRENEYYHMLDNTTCTCDAIIWNPCSIMYQIYSSYSVQAQTNTTLWTRGSPLSILGNATLLLSVFAKPALHICT